MHQLHSTPTDAHSTLAHRDILYEIIADGPFSCSTDLRRTHDAAEHQRHWFLLLRLGPKTPTHEATVLDCLQLLLLRLLPRAHFGVL